MFKVGDRVRVVVPCIALPLGFVTTIESFDHPFVICKDSDGWLTGYSAGRFVLTARTPLEQKIEAYIAEERKANEDLLSRA